MTTVLVFSWIALIYVSYKGAVMAQEKISTAVIISTSSHSFFYMNQYASSSTTSWAASF